MKKNYRPLIFLEGPNVLVTVDNIKGSSLYAFPKKLSMIQAMMVFCFMHLASTNLPTPNESNVYWVDPFIGTADDHGQTSPAASIPFGMAQPGPDTDPIGHAGYDYNAKKIIGFSNNRFSGVGCSGTGGNLRVLPYIPTIPLFSSSKFKYDKSTERASPGYYEVMLSNGIHCEMTATRAVATHCYTFPKSNLSAIAVDLNSAFHSVQNKKYKVEKDGRVWGKISAKTVCGQGTYQVFFALAIDKRAVNIKRKKQRLIYFFPTEENESIQLYVAFSTVSSRRALVLLEKTMPQGFDQIKEAAQNEWAEKLDIIQVETEDLSLKKVFYTHLFHVLQTPFAINDPDGRYRGNDGIQYQNNNGTQYHGWSIWDTFRTKLPLVAFLYPNVFQDITISLKGLYEQKKVNWATKKEPYLTVRTEHAIVVLLDAYQKGLLPFDLESIYPALKKEMDRLSFKSPDQVLESSYDLWAFSEIAKIVGNLEDHQAYRQKAFEYQNTWKAKFLHMNEQSDIMHGDGLYEGTLWQYRWFVPFDIPGIQSIMGGKGKFEAALDEFFQQGYFNIGNQPDIQVPFLYAYTDAPWKSQELVHQILTEPTENWYGTHEKFKKPVIRKVFTDNPDGFIKEMDDDGGTMSAWFVWASMGLYPICPGSPQFIINTPLFEKITIQMGSNPLIIQAHRKDPDDQYIQQVKFNNQQLNSVFIDANQLMKGGQLEIFLGEKMD